MKKILTGLLLVLLGTISLNSYSESTVESLSPELRALLQQEMQAIQGGMQNIIPAFAAGDLDKVADIAEKISNSYILKQRLSESQKHELHKKLSTDFIAKDEAFHKYAGMLEHVSKAGHTELVGFYYSKLMVSCVGCHSEHAQHRFPIFTKTLEVKEHHH